MIKMIYDIFIDNPKMIIFVILGIVFGVVGTVTLIPVVFNIFATKKDMKKDFDILNESFDRAHEITISKIEKLENKFQDIFNELLELNKKTSYLQGKVEK